MAKLYVGDSQGAPAIVKVEEVAKKNVGMSIDDIINVADSIVSMPDTVSVIDFFGIERIESYVFSDFFTHRKGWIKNVSDVKYVGSFSFQSFIASSGVDVQNLGRVSFDSLVEVTNACAFRSFAYQTTRPASISKNICFPVLKVIKGDSIFQQFLFTGFYDPTPTIIDEIFPVLEEFSGANVLADFYLWEPTVPIIFSKVKKITGDRSKYSACFGGISKAGLVWYFPSVTELSGYVWNVYTAAGEIHFAAANQAAIEACEGYEYKWGFPNATIYFDL